MTERIPTDDEINAMSGVEFKVFENRLRRAAQRQNLALVKSRRRDPRAVDFGSYWLIDAERPNGVVAGGEWGIDLGAVADFLWGEGAWWRGEESDA